MRRLLVLTVLVTAAPALGQPAPEPGPGAPAAARTDVPLVARLGAPVAGLAVAAVATELAGTVIDPNGDRDFVSHLLTLQAGYTVGVAAALPLLADWAGGQGDVQSAFVGGLVGGSLGLGVTGGLLLVIRSRPGEDNLGLGALALIGGPLVTVVAAPRLAGRGYAVAPAALSAPTGEAGAGLTARIGL